MIRRLQFIFLVLTAFAVQGADHFLWYPKARTVDVEIRGMRVEQFLGLVRAETGWDVMMEPGLDRVVSGRFRNKPASEALRLLLGRTRFALVPAKDGTARLKVFNGLARAATQSVEAVEAQAFAEQVDEAPKVDDGRLITMPVKVHYLKSQYTSINANPKLTNLRPLMAGVNEIWQRGRVRFTTGIPKPLRPVSRDAEKTYADLFKPNVPADVVEKLLGPTCADLLPNFPDRGKVIHLGLVYTMPQGYGAVYMPAKGLILMPQVKFAKLVSPTGVWKNGSDVFFAQSNILAHELGHALSLEHVATQGNLMIDGAIRQGEGVGPELGLTPVQIVAARKQAFTGGPYVPGINPPNRFVNPKPALKPED